MANNIFESNEAFMNRTREQSTAIYEATADYFAGEPEGTTWTNAQICAAAGFDSSESAQARALESKISQDVRDGVDRAFARREITMGFSRQIALDKDLGEHHLKKDGDYLLNILQHKMALAMRGNLGWSNYCGELLEEHRGDFTLEEGMTLRLSSGMAARMLYQLQEMAEDNVPELVKRYPAYAPLEDILHLLTDTAEEMER